MAQEPTVETNLPPVRRRVPTAQIPDDVSAQQLAQIEAEQRLAASETSLMPETERHALETGAAVERRAAEEVAAEENTRLSLEAGQQQRDAQTEYQTQLEAYRLQEAAKLAASPDEPLETPAGHVRVVVQHNYTLVRDDGTSVTFTTNGTNTGIPGTWDMTEDDAGHWFSQAHSDDPPPAPAPIPGTAAAIAIATQTAQRRALVEAALDQEEQAEVDKLRRERHDRLKTALGDAYEPSPR